MNRYVVLILILLTAGIISAGCISKNVEKQQAPSIIQTQTAVPQVSKSPISTDRPTITPSETVVTPQSKGTKEEETGQKRVQSERAADMESFISITFPQVTESYTDIKKSKNALDWKAVQDESLHLQTMIQDLKRTYQLNTPHPEKTVYTGLDSRKEIIFLKYIQFLNDMESYATNLKNAVYYQQKGSDPESSQTSRRYQGLADQAEKQAIAEVKTIDDYCRDFKYTFFDVKTVDQYRYTG